MSEADEVSTMFRRWLGGLLPLALILVFGATARAEDKVVRIYNWSDYIDPAILEDFTKETGIAVVYDVYDDNSILDAQLLAGNTGYDLVVPTANYLARQLQANIYAELDKSKLPNLANL